MDKAANNQSPRVSGETGSSSLNSSQSGRPANPWSQIARGVESESVAASSSSSGFLEQVTQSSSSDCTTVPNLASSSSSLQEDSSMEVNHDTSDCGTGNNNAGKKPAWNKPSNGDIEVGPVMGAFAWPPLSESTKASPKSSSSESLKALSDGSFSLPQGSGIASSSLQKQKITNNPNPSLTPNHAPPTRQKSMRRGGGSLGRGVTANGGGFSEPAPPSPVLAETPSSNAGKSDSVVSESSSSRDNTHKESGQRGNIGSQPYGGNDHSHQQRNPVRRGNGGAHPRGNGSYHHQDRGNHDWNRNRSFNGREAHMNPSMRGVSRGIMPPPSHSPTSFIPPPHVTVRPYGGPMVFPEVPSPFFYFTGPPPPPESLRAMPIVAPVPPPHMFYPVPDPQLHNNIVNQIDYYFSYDNLIKDTFLRKNMDAQGWVQIQLIASFKKVRELTDNIQLILDAMRASTVVEVQSDKVRKREDWSKWVLAPVQYTTGASSVHSSGRSSPDMLASSVQNVSLEEKTAPNQDRSSTWDLNGQSQPSSGEGTS